LERLRIGAERDPVEKAAAIAAFKTSLHNTGATNAARARRAIRRNKNIGRKGAVGAEAAVPALARPRV
jgi:hypothetical protein